MGGACKARAGCALQGSNKTGGHCTTCLFPTYPGLESIDVATYKQMDFSDKWVYFLGDISIRQMYGEFAALVHRAQVRPASSLLQPSLGWSAPVRSAGFCIIVSMQSMKPRHSLLTSVLHKMSYNSTWL